MDHTNALLSEIEDFLRATGMSPSTFGHKTANDGKLVTRLRSGSTVTLETAMSILGFIRAQRSEKSGSSVGARKRRSREARCA